MDDGLDAARALLPDVRLESVDRLAGSDRSEVRRVRLHRPDGEPETVIVKSFRSGGEGWARETAALSVLPAGIPAPRLVTAGAEPPVAVLSDIGAGPSVADALLGDDPGAAAEAVGRWAEALARLHRGTQPIRDHFRGALATRSDGTASSEDGIGIELASTTRSLDDRLAALGIATSNAAWDEVRDLRRRLSPDGPAALTPSDACPDNNALVGDDYVLLDFEGAQWRHVAWDLAYLRVPWPTCWCSWRLPDRVADAALERYRALAGPGLADVTAADIDAAVVGWAFVGVEVFLAQALGDDPSLNADRPTPTRRAMILHRLGIAAVSAELPHAAQLAARLRADLVGRWGEVDLAYAPAFS